MDSSEMDSAFDRISVIKSLTVNNLPDISFGEMLEILTPLVLTEIPENYDDVDAKKRLDFLLARTANLYAYLRVLWASASHHRAMLRKTNAAAAEEMQKKKEALYELGNAVKLKYGAASRKITVALEEDEETPDRASYDTRREARDERRAPPRPPTQETPLRGTSPRQRPSNVGWGNVVK